ncbi:MAG: signal peptidase [Bacteroidetes bacterium]|nr:signal peptidase [Bacteroidota bacterium]
MNTETQTLSSRLKKPVRQWTKCTFWSVIYILFVAWVGNFWWLLLLPLIFDAYITKYIPWTWWKKSKNKTVLSIMSWVDAIVFALIAVYFIHTYLFQNYQIPSSSLEKSLLVGDFLAVSKASYGPRVPMTPLSFPLVQHTFPILKTKSFLEKPQWKYKRLKGTDILKRNDIVVFNFPTGDTVCVKQENPDYYIQCFRYGRDVVRSRTDIFGEIVYRPVDRRENYVKRCVGIAGDWLEVKNNQVIVNGKPQEHFPGIQYNYFVQTDGTRLTNEVLEKMNISFDDIALLDNSQAAGLILSLGMDPKFPVYNFPLTEESYKEMQNTRGVTKLVIEPCSSLVDDHTFPLGYNKNWTRDNYGPIYIPKKGAVLKLTTDNLPIYERIIRVYENNKLEVKNGQIFINDQPATSYRFKMDYYWMMGDNRHKSADSRYWGFVPEDHIVGRPLFVWLSLDKDKTLFGGKIRWNRFFKNAMR